MEENIIRGIITDCETGESWSVEHCLFVTGAELSTIVRVLKVESYENPEDGSMQISLDCQALDSIGSVFNLGVDFTPKAVSGRDQILRDLKVDSILLMHGRYLSMEDGRMTLTGPEYRPVDPAFASEDQIREVFRFNSGADRKKPASGTPYKAGLSPAGATARTQAFAPYRAVCGFHSSRAPLGIHESHHMENLN